jgi:hypothetical protein
MGLRAAPESTGVFVGFLVIALLPALWLPPHLERPSDILMLFLYFAVHIQSAMLLPLVSDSPLIFQLGFVAAMTVAFLALELRRLLPRLRPPSTRPSAGLYSTALVGFALLSLVVFARSGQLTTANLDVVDVYGHRALLQDQLAALGKVFVYAANWSGMTVAPFLVVLGLHTRRRTLVILGAGLGFAAFVVSSNRSDYMAIPAVFAGYYFLRVTRGRYLGGIMGGAFIVLTLTLVAVDRGLAIQGPFGLVPLLTFEVFHRTFSNNGYLSAIYLDVFRTLPPAYYADSFLRWLPGPRLSAPVPLIAGTSFTNVPGNWANGNLWADAYANVGYLGMAFEAVITGLTFWVLDSFAADKDRVFSAAALIVPATVLANTATQTALTSNGLMLLVPLLLWAPLGAVGREQWHGLTPVRSR